MQNNNSVNPELQKKIIQNLEMVEILNKLGIEKNKALRIVFQNISREDIQILRYEMLRNLKLIRQKELYEHIVALPSDERYNRSIGVLKKLLELGVVNEETLSFATETLTLLEKDDKNPKTKAEKISLLTRKFESGIDFSSSDINELVKSIDDRDLDCVLFKYPVDGSEPRTAKEIERIFLIPFGKFVHSEYRVLRSIKQKIKVSSVTLPGEEPSNRKRLDYPRLISNYLSCIGIEDSSECLKIAEELKRKHFELYIRLYPADGSKPLLRSEMMQIEGINYEKVYEAVEKTEETVERYVPGFKTSYQEYLSKRNQVGSISKEFIRENK